MSDPLSPDDDSVIELLNQNLVPALRLTQLVAKRMVQQGGVRINGERVDDVNAQVSPVDGMILQVGKRKFARLKVV